MLRRDQQPGVTPVVEYLLSPQSSRMSPSDLGVFVCTNHAAEADGAGSANAAADSPVAAGWLGKGCGKRDVRALRLLHRAAQLSGKQRRAWAVLRRDVAYLLCCVDVCWCRPRALVSDGRAMSVLSHSTESAPHP